MNAWRVGEKAIQLFRPAGNLFFKEDLRNKVEILWQTMVNHLSQSHVLGLAQAAAPTYRRRLGSTEKGYFALLPQKADVKDRIVILEGGKLPLVVRPSEDGDTFELIGEAYVHGIMFGESWKPEACETIRIC